MKLSLKRCVGVRDRLRECAVVGWFSARMFVEAHTLTTILSGTGPVEFTPTAYRHTRVKHEIREKQLGGYLNELEF